MENDELFTYSRILVPKLVNFVWSDINYDTEEITLSSNQCRLILQILAHPERNMRELGIKAEIKKSTMTGIVQTLENDKIIERSIDKNDRRRTMLNLTDLGNKIGYSLRKKNRTNFIIKKDSLSKKDQKELETCVKNLNEIMDKIKENNNAQN